MSRKGVRIYDLARRLAVPSKDLLDMLTSKGIEVKSHMSTIDASTADMLLETFGAKKVVKARKVEPGQQPRPKEPSPLPPPIEPKKRGEPERFQEARPWRRPLGANEPLQRREKPSVKREKPLQYRNIEQIYEKERDRGRGREFVKRKDAPERRGHPPLRAQVPEKDWGAEKPKTVPVKKAPKVPGKRHEKFEEEYDRIPGKKRELGARLETPAPYVRRRPYKKPDKAAVGRKQEKLVVTPEELPKRITLPEVITVQALAEKMRVPPAKVIRHLMTMGILANVNQVLETEAAKSIAESFEFEVEIASVNETSRQPNDVIDVSKLRPRHPVVTIMGHVDHGKTTLLDAIRESKIADSEFGGITQHIGAYSVEVHGQKIVFLDTPGHEAFTAMRARGAQVTDEVVLVVAADDGVMPQTIEAIDHARAANVPIVVAINKIDLPGANPDRVLQELTKYGLTPEDWGGETICVKVSAKQRKNLDDLLEMILLQAEMLELKANPECPAKGVVVEALLDKGRGPVATVLVQQGTLRVGEPFVTGTHYGKVRAILDDRGRRLQEAGPSTPIEVLGLTGVPIAGDAFVVVESERDARQIAASRQEQQQKTEFLKTSKITLEELHHHIKEGAVQELRLVIKADVHGSVEALSDALERLSTDKVRLLVIHGGVGAINESDVMLAAASNAIVLGFNVRPVAKAREMAEKEQIDVRLYNVIYQAIDDIKKAMEGLLAPTYKEVLQGQATVQALFSVPKIGIIAGCRVTNGKIVRNSTIRVLREKTEAFKGNIASLRRVKDDVREVSSGYECGIRLENFDAFEVGDIIEAYSLEKVTMTLEGTPAKQT